MAGESQYAFRHALVGDVAYGQSARRDRVHKHLRLAGWIKAMPSDRAEDRAELAGHYLTAAETAQAAGAVPLELHGRRLRALREAGDRAKTLNSPR